ncbi:hypothetical protein Y032_0006g2880 [Ancylostoma ceylanicum]|uniref:Uncharacterized protein n=1 Tax=Ancylostoma ceylanicum TaxID=53326 RepID=A0A016VPC7_9BILA|nr:hypothetical protein Y032_0006g2880 [Ancylostoma ceylanicum]
MIVHTGTATSIHNSCREDRLFARAVLQRRGCRIAAGPARSSHSEHALSASLVQVPLRFCTHGIRIPFRDGL